jgi:hypothetical protein
MIPGNYLQHHVGCNKIGLFSISFVCKDCTYLQAPCQIFADRSPRSESRFLFSSALIFIFLVEHTLLLLLVFVSLRIIVIQLTSGKVCKQCRYNHGCTLLWIASSNQDPKISFVGTLQILWIKRRYPYMIR